MHLRIRGNGSVTEISEHIVCTWDDPSDLPNPAELDGGYETLIDREAPMAFGRTSDWDSEPDEEVDDLAEWLDDNSVSSPDGGEAITQQVNQGLISLACKRYAVTDDGLYDTGFVDVDATEITDLLRALSNGERIDHSDRVGLTRDAFEEGPGGPHIALWMPIEEDGEDVQRWLSDYEDWIPSYPPNHETSAAGINPWLLALLFSPSFGNNRKSAWEYSGSLESMFEDVETDEEKQELERFVDQRNAFWEDPSLPLPTRLESVNSFYAYREYFEEIASEPVEGKLIKAEMNKVLILAELPNDRKLAFGDGGLFPNDVDRSAWDLVEEDVFWLALEAYIQSI
jgi:hypothetical protein